MTAGDLVWSGARVCACGAPLERQNRSGQCAVCYRRTRQRAYRAATRASRRRHAPPRRAAPSVACLECGAIVPASGCASCRKRAQWRAWRTRQQEEQST